ncbi:molybdate ABC transporter substrate-binding protein [Calothrix sp. 336/3]|uniref:molybdate ABC transporter substrate-binding protein n=1 Tax=Calothrix sp. 336/3 TaxID=1337936 RepID=UPI0004E33BA5|nr:molybdate ABC transporter substrate-binding protein [Calothrix sp. 336/3]AKG20060.1 molybdate ABC transporter substrate-binding protein [Calothrix sp. 336/3]
MYRRKLLAFISMAIASLLLAVALPFVSFTPVAAQSNTTLLVSAAASLKDVLEEIKPIYQQTQKNIKINFNFGSSGALLQQIQQGAPVDIFISAAKKQMDTLEQTGQLIAATRSNIAKNRLVLVVPQKVVGVTSLYNLKDSKIKKIAIGEPRTVPAGQYAEQVLKKLRIYEQVKSKFVYANNVRQVLAMVGSGNADAGLVYTTDAKISRNVKVVVAADEKYHSPIVYPIAVLKKSKNVEVARNFAQYLTSEPAQAVLRKYGFLMP